MIEGLKVTVTGTELRELTNARAEHHEKRASQYAHQIQALPPDDDASGIPSSSNKPVDSMKAKRAEHDIAASEMRFIAAHVDLAETYLLSRDDLYRLGIVNARY